MFEYKPLELHCHTLHSDGRFTVSELCSAARAAGLEGIALTDHNTTAGWQELSPELEAHTLPVARGIEWTTFFGHMVVIGADKFVDWRFVKPDTIDSALAAIRKAGGCVGIAHPFNVGGPLCTGGHWDYSVTRWDLVDYIEVWSQSYDPNRYKNQMAYRWWTELLNQGCRVAASSGRDWHRPGPPGELAPVTYLGLAEGAVNTRTVREALWAGRSYCTCGPTLELHMQCAGAACALGDRVAAGMLSIDAAVHLEPRREIWEEHRIQPQELRLIHNGAIVLTKPCSPACRLDYAAKTGWLRVELWGDCQNVNGQLLAFTSPLYVD